MTNIELQHILPSAHGKYYGSTEPRKHTPAKLREKQEIERIGISEMNGMCSMGLFMLFIIGCSLSAWGISSISSLPSDLKAFLMAIDIIASAAIFASLDKVISNYFKNKKNKIFTIYNESFHCLPNPKPTAGK